MATRVVLICDLCGSETKLAVPDDERARIEVMRADRLEHSWDVCDVCRAEVINTVQARRGSANGK